MKSLTLFLLVFFGLISVVFAASSLSTNVQTSPTIFQAIGGVDATLPAARYPIFSNAHVNNMKCASDLETRLSNTYISGIPQVLSPVSGLQLTIPIPVPAKNSDLLINWTIRVEGISNPMEPSPDPKSGLPNLCRLLGDSLNWTGHIDETFPSGNVYSQAYVDLGNGASYKPMGQEIAMTIPDSGGTVYSDPTHTGSYLLKSPLGGFNPQIGVKIYWRNDTSQIITSKANYRSIIVTLVPVSK